VDSRQYELIFILPPTLAEDETAAIVDAVQGWITEPGGEIVKVSHWGRRRLEYVIQNYKEGYYILFEFKADPKSIKDLDRRVRLETSILRHLIVKVDD
jgi:small subunit ribosomal protein S6